MHIQLNGSTIEVNYRTTLKPRHISQLKYFGFSFVTGNNIFAGDVENLKRLLLYLTESNIAFTISDDCQAYIDKIKANDRVFQKIKSIGSNIKDGKIDKMSLLRKTGYGASHADRGEQGAQGRFMRGLRPGKGRDQS